MATSVTLQVRGEGSGPFLHWTFVALVLLIVGRQLLTVLDNQSLNRRLAAMVGQLEQASSHEVAVRVAVRILEAMCPPFTLGGAEVQVGASVGVTVSDATEVDDVLREADVAMYTAKARGNGRFELAGSPA